MNGEKGYRKRVSIARTTKSDKRETTEGAKLESEASSETIVNMATKPVVTIVNHRNTQSKVKQPTLS